MPDAKITITGEDKVSDMFVRVGEGAQHMAQSVKDAGDVTQAAGAHTSALHSYLEELIPSTNNAHAAFTDLRGTITEMWENPTAAVRGFASALGSDLAGGLGTVGIAAGVAAGAIAAVGFGLYELGEHAASVGGTINDMSEKMSLSAERTSTLKYAMDIAGGSIGQASNLIFQLQRRMADSPDEVEKGLNRIGLSIQQLESLEPDQQLYTISKAFQENTNQTNRAATAMELFSRSGRDAIPLLMKDLTGLSAEAEHLGYVWSEQDAKAAEDFEMKSRALHERWTQMTIAVGRDMIPAMTGLIGVAERTGEAFVHIADLGGLVSGTYERLKGLLGDNALAAEQAAAKQDVINKALSLGAPEGIAFADAVNYVNQAFGRVPPAVDAAAGLVENWYKALDEARDKAEKQAAAQKLLTDGLAAHGVVMGATAEEMVAANRDWEAAVRKRAEEEKKAREEAEKTAAFWREYNTLGLTIADTYFRLDGAVAEGIANDLRRGATIDMVTKAWGVNKEQVKAVADEEKFLASVQDTTKTALSGMLVTIPDLSHRTGEFRDKLEELYATFNQFSGGVSVAGDQLDHVILPAFSTLPNVTAAGTEALKAAHQAMDGGTEASDRWANSLGGVAKMFAQLGQVSGGTLGDIMKSLGQIAVLTSSFEKDGGVLFKLAGGTMDENGKATGGGIFAPGSTFGVPTSKGGQMGFAGAQVGAGMLASATDDYTTKGGQVTHYASLGAEYGAVAGPYGMAIGAGVGALVGALKVSPEELAARKSLEDFQKQFGGMDAMIKAVGESYARLGKTGVEAEGDIRAALDASHGSAEAEATALAKINGVLDAQKQRTKDVADATAALGPSFAAVSTGITKPILDAYAAANNADTALEGGIATLGAGMQKASSYTSGLVIQIKDVQAQIATLEAKTTPLTASQTQQLSDLHTKLLTLNAAFGDLSATQMAAGKSLQDMAAHGKQGLDDLGTQAVASFAAMVAGGSSVSDALKSIGPSLANLQASYTDLGLGVDDVALKNLMMQSTITSGNPALMNAIGGLSGEMGALQKLGVANVDTFGAMERSGGQLYTQLQAQVAAVGGSARDALIPMQGFLHDAMVEAENLGTPLDANTQMLITQSQELGIWKDTGKSSADVLNDSMKALVDRVGDLIAKLSGPGGVTDAIGSIPRHVDVTVQGTYVPPANMPSGSDDAGGVDGASTGGWVTAAGIHHFAVGGVVPGARGTDTVPAMLTPGELVLNRNQQNAVGALMRGGGLSDAHIQKLGDRLEGVLKRQGDRIEQLITLQPMHLRHALRGVR